MNRSTKEWNDAYSQSIPLTHGDDWVLAGSVATGSWMSSAQARRRTWPMGENPVNTASRSDGLHRKHSFDLLLVLRVICSLCSPTGWVMLLPLQAMHELKPEILMTHTVIHVCRVCRSSCKWSNHLRDLSLRLSSATHNVAWQSNKQCILSAAVGAAFLRTSSEHAIRCSTLRLSTRLARVARDL